MVTTAGTEGRQPQRRRELQPLIREQPVGNPRLRSEGRLLLRRLRTDTDDLGAAQREGREPIAERRRLERAPGRAGNLDPPARSAVGRIRAWVAVYDRDPAPTERITARPVRGGQFDRR